MVDRFVWGCLAGNSGYPVIGFLWALRLLSIRSSQLAQLKSCKTVGRLLATSAYARLLHAPAAPATLRSYHALIYASLSHANCSFPAQVCF